MSPPRLPPIAITMGEPAGVGGEIALQAWARLRESGETPFFLLDDPARLARLRDTLGWSMPVEAVATPQAAVTAFARALPVLALDADCGAIPGRPDPGHAGAVVEAIDRAVALAREGSAAAVVTNPIHKESLLAAGFRHAGHTSYLAELAGGVAVEMMLASPLLRVVPMTVHRPLREAVGAVRRDAVIGCVRRTARALIEDFGIAAPRIAVTGLNPHAGEGGAIGREEIEEIAPAIERLRAGGIRVSGPHPADSLFHADARAGYDAAVCMYHDQALIPIKTLDFRNAVNVTLGLPFVRTSPDHGTAFDIAGTGRADPSSLIAAIRLADAIARRRAGG